MSSQATNQAGPRDRSEQLVIRDVATLKALADPLRLEILFELLQGPSTVKSVASALGVGATRLYYHFKILERAGLIRVAGTRMVSGIEERRYEAVATGYKPAPELTDSLVEDGIIGALLRVVRAELELALMARSPAPPGDPASPVPVLSFTALALSPADVEEVQRRLNALAREFEADQRPPGKRVYRALLVGYLAPQELRDP
jgi:DNA-binding transcriptional ArsR family regulator